MTENPQVQFAAEITSLREQLIEAVRQRRRSTLDDGLDVLVDVARSLLRRTRQIDTIMGAPRTRLPSFEDQLLSTGRFGISNIRETITAVMEQSLRESDSAASLAVISGAVGLCVAAWEEEDLASFAQFSRHFVSAADLMLSDVSSYRASIGLKRLAEGLNSSWNVTVGRGSEASYQRTVTFSEATLACHLELARLGIDRPSATALDDWATAYSALFEPLEFRHFHAPEAADTLRLLKQAGFLAVRAWILFCYTEDWISLDSEEANLMVTSIARLGHPETSWNAMLADAKERLAEQLGWHHWEMMRWPTEFGARALTFDGYFLDSYLMDLLTRAESLAVLRTEGAQSAADPAAHKAVRDLASRLRARVEGVLERYRSLLSLDAASVGILETDLEHIGDIAKRTADDVLGAMELDRGLVDEFRDGVLEGVNSRRRITIHLAPCEYDGSERTAFGLNLLVPKDYFVKGDVYADAAELGKQFGTQVVQGETEQVLADIRSACGTSSYAGGSLVERLTKEVARLKDDYAPQVFVFGDFAAWEEIRSAADPRSLEGPRRFDDPVEFAGVTCWFINDSVTEAVVVADPTRLACFHRARISADFGDSYDNDTVLLVVKRVDVERAREIAQSRLSQGQFEEDRLQEQQRELMLQAHVRVFTKPVFVVLDGAAGILVTSTDDLQTNGFG